MPAAPLLGQRSIASNISASQHGPRPLPLFLALLWSVTQHDPELRKRAFAGLRRYQEAPRPAESEPRRVVARSGRASLTTRGGAADPAEAITPVVIVPSLINPPDVCDLTPRRSLLRYLLRAGHDAYLLDWGTPSEADREQGFAAHIELLLLPLLAEFRAPPVLIGYCLGGTLAIGAAARLAAKGETARGLASIAAPWDFAQYDAPFRAQIAQIWAQNRPGCEALGLVPLEILQAGFWSLDPERTIRKYADFLDLEEDSLAWRGFVTLEDWANEGAPLTLASGLNLVDDFYSENRPGLGNWTIADTLIDPAVLSCPTLAVASTADAIVPAATTPPADTRIDLSLGHVGMMIGGRAEQALWAPLADWIASLPR